MSNRLDDVLAAIDAETAKCICGSPVPTDGPSLDYCSLPCQYRWTAQHVGETPDYEHQHNAASTADGRAINAQAAQELATTLPYASPYDAMEAGPEPESDVAREGGPTVSSQILGELIRTATGVPERISPAIEPISRLEPRPLPLFNAESFAEITRAMRAALESAASSFQEVATELTPPTTTDDESASGQPIDLRYTVGGITYHGTGHATRLPDGSVRLHGSFDPRCEPREQLAEPPQPVEDESNGTTRIMWVPEVANPNAPTARELAAGVTLGVLDENGRLQTETPTLLTPEVLYRSLQEARDAYYLGYWEAPRVEPEPALTGDELRARALEHRHNRGTGPARRDNRRWRNPR